jgi:non-ribosomal peptide synthetase component F
MHRNFIASMFSLVHIGVFNKTDIFIQMSSCTFDAHVLEILGALLCSATVVMLHPYGNMDSIYLIQTLQKRQVTFMAAVPASVKELSDFIKNRNMPSLANIRTLCSGG